MRADAGRRRQPARTQPRQPGTERAGAAGHLLHLAAHRGAGDVERLQSARRRLRRVADALQRFLPGRADVDELGLDLAAVGQRQADGDRLVGHGNPRAQSGSPVSRVVDRRDHAGLRRRQQLGECGEVVAERLAAGERGGEVEAADAAPIGASRNCPAHFAATSQACQPSRLTGAVST